MKLFSGAITTGSGTLCYTVPTGYLCDVEDIEVANTTAAAVTCAIHLCDSGESVVAGNQLFPTTSIPANTLVQWTGKQTLNAGDFIQGIGGASGVTVHISGTVYRKST